MALTATEETQLRELIDQQAAILSLASSESTIISKLGATKVTLADLSSAGTIGDSDLFLIRQGTSEKNVAGSVVKALASASVSAATTTTAGVVELATDAEVQAGTDPDRAVTPSTLSSRTATESRTGVVELATDAEAQAFTANKFIDGAKLASALQGANQSLAISGYQKLPGGLILQWGNATAAATSVTFPIAFPTECFNVQMTMHDTSYASAIGADYISVFSVTTAGFTKRNGSTYSGTRKWFAMGN